MAATTPIASSRALSISSATCRVLPLKRIDTALGTTYSADSDPYLSCSASSYNVSTVQTLSYEMSAGTHYIDVKYRKNSSTNSRT